MYEGGSGAFGSNWHELYRLDRVLGQLTRPALEGTGVPSALRDQLEALGLQAHRAARREDLIAEVWGRKRPLLRRMDAGDDLPPACA